MDLSAQLSQVDFNSGKNADRLNFLDLRFSNLPLDYLNGVLPTAQFGSESVAPLSDKPVQTSNDYKAWTSNTPMPHNASSDVKVNEYPSGSTYQLVWTSGEQGTTNGGALYHTHTIPSDALSLSILS